ncbi:MAG TPA: hypothetical protein VHV30_02400 [Polyangiaceae bacterium]|jgi:hypothetical protein|nr:hypothetical protein [Polyangiaceae bacterium]
MRSWRRRAAGAAIGVFVVVAAVAACDAIAPITLPGAPMNACPEHPCAAFDADGGAPPTCNPDGLCAAQGAVPKDILFVIGLPTDTLMTPGGTYAVTWNRVAPDAQAPRCAVQDCETSPCVLGLPTTDPSFYAVSPAAAQSVFTDLGNAGLTAVPSQATYRLLLPSGPVTVDAIDLGLPFEPVPSFNVSAMSSFVLGPHGASPLEFQVVMQPGCYERTLQPMVPYAAAFPPEIRPWPLQRMTVDPFDSAKAEFPVPPPTAPKSTTTPAPAYEIKRAEGLDGWTLSLRSTTNGRTYSNVAPLAGSDSTVFLATAQTVAPIAGVTAGVGDGLDGLELVAAPPAGLPLPTLVIRPVLGELAGILTYPSLPLPSTVSGKVVGADGQGVPGTVVFTARDVLDRTGAPEPDNFEFVTRVTATLDSRTGVSTYSAVLPQGDYDVAVQPTDGTSAVTVSNPNQPLLAGGTNGVEVSADLQVGRLVSVTGTALVADRRPLNEAVVEIVPVACASSVDAPPTDASTTQALAVASTADACMPRAAETVTDEQGSFSLALDPGSYTLRVRPVEGSHLPWVHQSLTIAVGEAKVPLDPILVPAPIPFRMALQDYDHNAVVKAQVRVFTDPTLTGKPPIELGRTLTDTSGNFEIDLNPAE